MSPSTSLLLAVALNLTAALSSQHSQMVGELQPNTEQPPSSTDITKRTHSSSSSEEALLISNEVDESVDFKHTDELLSKHLTAQRGVRARRNTIREPKSFGFSFGTNVRSTNEAKKREVASIRTTATTKRPFPFWKQRTSTTKRPITSRPKSAALTTKRAFPRWKPSTGTDKPVTTPAARRTIFKWPRTASTARPTPTTKRPSFSREQTTTTKRPLTTTRPLPKWLQRTTTTTKRPSTTTKRPLPKWLQRATTTKRPSTTNKSLKTTEQTTTRRPKSTRQASTKRPTTGTTTKRPARRLFTKQPTTKRATVKRPTTSTERPSTTKSPGTTTKRTTTAQATTTRPTTRRIKTKQPTEATKRLTPTTRRPVLFSARGAKRTQTAHRPIFRFSSRPSSSAVTTPKPTSQPDTEPVPEGGDPLTSLLMQIASLSPRRTVGSPSVLLAIAALANPPAPNRPAVRLDPKQEGFHLSLKHQPEGACAPCMPTFLVDLEKCHPCVVIR